MREEERLNKIRELLLQQEKASFADILEKTGLASVDLSYDLLKLIRNGEIGAERDTRSNRVIDCEYILVHRNRALAEAKRHETIQFIENMKEPISIESKTNEDRYRTLMSIFAESQPLDKQKIEFLQQKLDKIVENSSLTVSIKEILERYTINKLALVFAFEKKRY
jgi:hypothetical protein